MTRPGSTRPRVHRHDQPRPQTPRVLPLVTVPCVHVGAHGLEIEWDLPRSVRAVDDREDARLPGGGADLLDRKHERCRRGDVRDEYGARSDADVRDQLVGLAVNEVRPDERERPHDRAVLVLRREDLLLRPDPKRAERPRSSHRSRSARRRGLAARAPTKAAREARAPSRRLEPDCPSQNQVLRRLAKKSVGCRSSSRCHRWYSSKTADRTRAVAAVIEVDDVGIEEKAVAHSALVSHGARPPPHVFPAASAIGRHAPGRRALNSFGNGIVLPFMFIYLHNVRGIGLAVAGLIVATHALVSIVAGPVFGSLDRPLRRARACSRSRS